MPRAATPACETRNWTELMPAGVITNSVSRIFADLADPQTLNADVERGWHVPLWRALEENGLTRAWVSETLGGADLDIAEGFEIISVAGRFALPVPLVETMLAAWLLAQANIASPAGAMSLAPTRVCDSVRLGSDGTLTGIARSVPFAAETGHLAVFIAQPRPQIALVRTADCRLSDTTSLSGDTRHDVDFTGAVPLAVGAAPPNFIAESVWLMGCTARSLQIAGALQEALSLSVDYANERIAFGKTIGRFQSVQNILARLAGEVAAAAAAADSAADAVSTGTLWDDSVHLEICAAKIRCADAAEAGSAMAHQVHGAIGLTEEHILHRFTLRAQEWRDDFGNESHWAVSLGNRITAAGGARLWPLIASR